ISGIFSAPTWARTRDQKIMRLLACTFLHGAKTLFGVVEVPITKRLTVNDLSIGLKTVDNKDFISLTDIARYRNQLEPFSVINNWLRSRSTIEYLGLWEKLNNPDFKPIEFDRFKNEAGSNYFTLSPQRWADETHAVGLISKSERYGGTFAHKDIAFEFASWISPEFKLYLITEFQRLKEIESSQYNLEWNVKRVLSKVNYTIHTDAVQKHIIPQSSLTSDLEWLVYAEEADLLNVALFGCTAKTWRDANPELAKDNKNIRDYASINELAILSNIQTINAEMIKEKIDKSERFLKLKDIAKYQLSVLNNTDFVKAVKKLNDNSLIDEQKKLENK